MLAEKLSDWRQRGDGRVLIEARLLDRAAADKMLIQAMHFPFPANGHIVRRQRTSRAALARCGG